jgi:hypothetical protein
VTGAAGRRRNDNIVGVGSQRHERIKLLPEFGRIFFAPVDSGGEMVTPAAKW